MTRLKTPLFCSCLFILSLHCRAPVRLAFADDSAVLTNAPAAAPADAGAPPAEEAVVVSNQSTLRSTLEIQDQLHNLEIADEKARRQAEADAAHNASLLNQRFGGEIEAHSLASQHLEGASGNPALATSVVHEGQHSGDLCSGTGLFWS